MVKGAAQVLEWEPEDGWEPLCHFLNVPVPNTKFPNMNQTEAFQKTVDGYFRPRMKRAARNLGLAVAILLLLVAFSVAKVVEALQERSWVDITKKVD